MSLSWPLLGALYGVLGTHCWCRINQTVSTEYTGLTAGQQLWFPPYPPGCLPASQRWRYPLTDFLWGGGGSNDWELGTGDSVQASKLLPDCGSCAEAVLEEHRGPIDQTALGIYSSVACTFVLEHPSVCMHQWATTLEKSQQPQRGAKG